MTRLLSLNLAKSVARACGIFSCMLPLFSYATDVVLGSVEVEHNRNAQLGLPHMANGNSELIISHDAFVASWNKELRVPNWVVWDLQRADLQGTNQRKGFVMDPDLKKYLPTVGSKAVSSSEYTNSCFDRGHQASAASRKATLAENAETFYTSNILPQTAWLNRIEWRSLEDYERSLVQNSQKHLVIVSGGVFLENHGYIGKNKDIAVPAYTYRIIVSLNEGEKIGQISPNSPMLVLKFPNLNSDGSEPLANMDRTCADNHSKYDRPADRWPASNVWLDYQVSLAEIEADTGYEFFTNNSFLDHFKLDGFLQ